MGMSPWVCRKRAAWFVRRLEPFLPCGEQLLDVGSGDGYVADHLRDLLRNVTCVDVEDLHLAGPTPRLYDGRTLPFETGAFDSVLLLTVLHHCPDPWRVFEECVRVARKRILVVEDRFDSPWQRWMTKLVHRIMAVAIGMSDVDLKFLPTTEWQAAFRARELDVGTCADWGCAPPFFPTRAGFFCLEKEPTNSNCAGQLKGIAANTPTSTATSTITNPRNCPVAK